MNSSQIPAKFGVVWASGASSSYLQQVPVTYSGDANGTPSLTIGWGPETFADPSVGGAAPLGEFENGIWNQATANMQWMQAGGMAVYDSAFSTAIGGYPKGAILAAASLSAFWRSTAENNTVDPDTGTLTAPASGWSVLQPGTYPWSQITGAPAFVPYSDWTGSSNQLVGVNGWQDDSGGWRLQWMEVVTGSILDALVVVTYPTPYVTTSYKPRASVFDATLTGSTANQFLGCSVISNTLAGCVVALGANGGSPRSVTLCVDVRGRTL